MLLDYTIQNCKISFQPSSEIVTVRKNSLIESNDCTGLPAVLIMSNVASQNEILEHLEILSNILTFPDSYKTSTSQMIDLATMKLTFIAENKEKYTYEISFDNISVKIEKLYKYVGINQNRKPVFLRMNNRLSYGSHKIMLDQITPVLAEGVLELKSIVFMLVNT